MNASVAGEFVRSREATITLGIGTGVRTIGKRRFGHTARIFALFDWHQRNGLERLKGKRVDGAGSCVTDY